MAPPDHALIARARRRHAAARATRAFFERAGFVEVETPMLVPATSLEPHIDPLSVEVRLDLVGTARARRYLHTSPELALKRALAGGLDKVYQLARVFRDGERTETHLPEFTMLEWYRQGASLDDLVADCETLFVEVARALGRPLPKVPFVRSSLSALFSEHAGIDLGAALRPKAPPDALAVAARARSFAVPPSADFEAAFFHVMDRVIEPALAKIDRPVVVDGWPACMAVLARLDTDRRFARRFEIYAGGFELANAFDELVDPVEQRARFLRDRAARIALGKGEQPLDEDFLAALHRLGPCAGIAVGFDRLLMWLCGASRIDEVQVLPWR